MISSTSEALATAGFPQVAFSLFPLFAFALFVFMLPGVWPLNSIDLAWPSWLLSLYSVDISFLLLSTLSLLLLRLP